MQLPTATYRIQLNGQFSLQCLEEILPYLHDLGVSTIYTSPITTSIEGSLHGYDVTDPSSIDPEIGSEEQLARLAGWLKVHDMGWLQDIVPNHMAFHPANPWIYNILARGMDSPYHRYFDILWEHPGFKGRIMAPFLGEDPDRSVNEGRISIQFRETGFALVYGQLTLPICIQSWHLLLPPRSEIPPALSLLIEQPMAGSGAPQEEWQGLLDNSLRAMREDPVIMTHIQQMLEGQAREPALVKAVMDAQHYILVNRKSTDLDINYRRFFGINTLICLRMEDRDVFSAYHRQILDMFRKKYFQGFRIDHIDGLADPHQYLSRLKAATDGAYIVAEKILTLDEPLPETWLLDGSTGYDALAYISQLLTDPAGADALKRLYRDWNRHADNVPDNTVDNTEDNTDDNTEDITKENTEGNTDLDHVIFSRKYAFLRAHMNGELDHLSFLAARALAARDLTPDPPALKEALALILCSLPAYRAYWQHGHWSAFDRHAVRAAFASARAKNNSCRPALDLLACIFFPGGKAAKEPATNVFLGRFTLFTVPLAAKGIEDSSFYTYNLLLSHNEVGDTPSRTGIAVKYFHRFMQRRQREHPLSLNAGTTHDTKRGEDARMRLNFLSTIPDQWGHAVNSWDEAATSFLALRNGKSEPIPNDRYFIYQSLLAGVPTDLQITEDFRRRFQDYILKALREAGTITSWSEPCQEYEQHCSRFIDELLAPQSLCWSLFKPFAAKVISGSHPFVLAQVLLKLTVPGIPDIYQGSELFELSYVDPDNRRPVDYQARIQLLTDITNRASLGWVALGPYLAEHTDQGAAKLYVISKTLALRNTFPNLFARGKYIAIWPKEKAREETKEETREEGHLVFMRKDESNTVLIVTPLPRRTLLEDIQKGIQKRIQIKLPAKAPRRWQNLFTGSILECASSSRTITFDLSPSLQDFPVGLFIAIPY